MASHITENCIEWNEAERRRAQADANNSRVRVPATAKRREPDGRVIPLTAEEYRDQRAKDAVRYAQNIMALRQGRTA